MDNKADIIVIGAGIAGMSVAAELAADAKVIVLDMEAHPGYHSSGRSAAFFAPSYGNAAVRGLTAASELFFRCPPVDFSDSALLNPRDCYFVASDQQHQQLLNMHNENSALVGLSRSDITQQLPILSDGDISFGLLDKQGGDIDVHALLQGYLRCLRLRGGQLCGDQKVLGIKKLVGGWHLQCQQQSYSAPIVVNAAGAWASDIALRANLPGVEISPLRRTAVLIDAPKNHDIKNWPLVIDVDERFYFKPDAGQLLISPADETISPACDAQPDEYDIAVAVQRFEQVTGISVAKVNHSWAGLRSFSCDRTFVIGFDPRTDGFFWLAGQGGYGVQSAPAVAQLASHLITQNTLSKAYKGIVRYQPAVTPERFGL